MLEAAEKKLSEADLVLNVWHFLIVRKVKIRNTITIPTKTEKQDHISYLMWASGPTVERSSTDPDPSPSKSFGFYVTAVCHSQRMREVYFTQKELWVVVEPGYLSYTRLCWAGTHPTRWHNPFISPVNDQKTDQASRSAGLRAGDAHAHSCSKKPDSAFRSQHWDGV